MNTLPLYLLDEILFRLEPKSLTMIRCASKYFNSYISDDPYFKIQYFSHVRSSFIFKYCSDTIGCFSTTLGKSEDLLLSKFLYEHCGATGYWRRSELCILDSCSGLLLLYIGHLLFVVNPLTKRLRLIDQYKSKNLPKLLEPHGFKRIRFLAERNQTTKRFKIVCILETDNTYKFEIGDGDSWRLSNTTITPASKSFLLPNKSVYLDGTLHWLRYDGSIIAFNPETEHVCFISSSFQPYMNMELYFAVDVKINRLTLLSRERETISVYTLLKSSKWTLTRRIKNVSMEESKHPNWNIITYDGKRLLMTEKKKIGGSTVLHEYDMEANSWEVLGSTKRYLNSPSNFLKFTPSLFSVENEQSYKEIVASNDKHISILAELIGFININSCVS